jgi:hypothetical protein
MNGVAIDFTTSSGSTCEIATSGLDTTASQGSITLTACVSGGYISLACDSPNVVLPATGYSEVKTNESFSTFLMYQPQNGVWVPVYEVDWSWAADAVNSGNGWAFKGGGNTASSGGAGPSVKAVYNATLPSGKSVYPQWQQAVNLAAPCNPK